MLEQFLHKFSMFHFSNTPLIEIYHQLHLYLQDHQRVVFCVVNPDLVDHKYNGEYINTPLGDMIYRGYKTWMDLAHQLACRFTTPQPYNEYEVCICYEKLADESFHSVDANVEQKYGQESIFSRIHKNEESGFLHYYMQALNNSSVKKRRTILNLGINQGDEFDIIMRLVDDFQSYRCVGIDYCASAIQHAKKRFADYKNIQLYQHDITQLVSLELDRFDLIVSIGTLQSTNLSFAKVLMDIVQNHLKKDGAIILGFPNCRWIDGEMIYGARMKNYNFSEMSNLYKDVYFAKKYLQQKKFRVTITGKDYIFITATSIL